MVKSLFKIAIILVALLPSRWAWGQSRGFTVVELNCENLFDCLHDSLRNDWEYCEDGMRHWTFGRYWKKLNSIGREIISCGGEGDEWRRPDLVALTEVENDSVMTMLAKHSLLKRAHYEYVMTDSPDERGIDVALLYCPQSFMLVKSCALRVAMPADHRPTRDILYAAGAVTNEEGTVADTLHVFVVHAPSRSGGAKASKPYRMLVSNRLCAAIDSIRAITPSAKIIVAGDFNDYHDSRSVRQLAEHGMHNVSAGCTGTHGAKGTYRYRGDWGSLDQILVSESLARQWPDAHCFIHDAEFLVEPDPMYGGIRPRRTYIGPRYDPDGFSDHLPLVLRFY